ncbi:MAG: SapC family protein [Gammaproteobacteria bacterium]|nr:SapC family protein [Gammaproteobacteria bacterium]
MHSAPPGYRNLVPFDRDRHRQYGVDPHAARFAAHLGFIYLDAIELVRASRFLPIVFARDAAGELVPVAQTGVEPGRNLFVDAAGDWDATVYCPAYVRRYPFYTAQVAGKEPGQQVICVDEAGLSAQSPALLDAAGEPTPLWEPIQALLRESAAAKTQTAAFCHSLQEFDLLEEFAAEFRPAAGDPRRLGGLLRVNEDRLRKIEPAALAELLRKGWLARIFAHLFSLENYGALVDRYAGGAVLTTH